jgi:hypothetical protein
LAGTIVTIKDCDLPALAQEYARQTAKPDRYLSVWLGGFASWLVASGHAMPADVQELHLGDSFFEDEFGVTDEIIKQAADAKKVNRG